MSAWTETLHEPTMVLSSSGLDNLELLLGGLYGTSVYSLPGGFTPGAPVELTLETTNETAESALETGALLLTDPDGTPLARLRVTGSTKDADGLRTYLSGAVSALQPAEHSPVRHMRVNRPLWSSEYGGQPPLVVAFSSMPHADEVSSAALRAKTLGRSMWLLGLTATTDTPALHDVLRELRRCEKNLDDTHAGMLVVPSYDKPSRIAGQSIGQYVLSQLGAEEVIDFTRAEHLEAGGATHKHRSRARGLVVLFTGLSGSGKSTLARALSEQLRESDEREVTLLDGDDVRRFLTAGLGFSREDRNTNVERIGWVAGLVSKTGGVALCAPIAPFAESRQRVRALAESAGQYILVHVSTPLEECEKRDRKGLYAKARGGLIPDFTGIDSPYDIPHDADYVVDTSKTSVESALKDLERIIKQGN